MVRVTKKLNLHLHNVKVVLETNNGFREYTREMMSKYMTELPCETCHGKRLSREALSVYVGGLNIGEVVEYSISQALNYYKTLICQNKIKRLQIKY